MSFKPLGSEIQVNAVSHSQSTPSVTMLSGGGHVVVWVSSNQDGGGRGIYGQRYDAAGDAVGSEFLINTTTDYDQNLPKVAALACGGFVVTWMDGDEDWGYGAADGEDGSGQGIFAQRYDGAGAKAGTEFQVNSYTTSDQTNPEITALSGGGFVVTWESKDQDGDARGVYGQRYSANGVTVGAEFQINTATASAQYLPAISALANNGFVVTWASLGQDGDGWGIYAQRYDLSVTPVGSEFRVNSTTASSQNQPSVATLTDGGFVVVWTDAHSDQIVGQRFDASGNAVGTEFAINTNAGSDPVIAALHDGGFVVTWTSDTDGSNTGVAGQAFDASGNLVGGEIQVNSTTNGYQDTPTVVGLSNGNFLTYWKSSGSGNGNNGILGQLFTASSSATGTVTISGTAEQGQTLTAAASAIADSDGITGISDGWRWLRDGRIIAGATSDSYTLMQADVGAKITAQYLFTDDAGGAEAIGSAATATIGNINDAPSGNLTVFGVASQGELLTADGITDADGITPANVTWQWFRDGVEIDGANAQTYRLGSADIGAAVSVRMAYTDDFGASESGISAATRTVEAAGVATKGVEVQVNTHTNSTQNGQDVAGFSDGSYVITWQSALQDGESYGVYAQRFDAAGAPVAGEFLVNTTTLGKQSGPAVTTLTGGGFVVVWSSSTFDAFGDVTGSDVYGQRYDASGSAVGSEFLINTDTAYLESASSIAALGNGGFVVTWNSGDHWNDGKDTDEGGVYAQRFNANGTKAGSEFRVNTETSGNQARSEVTGLASGGFVVTWTSDNQDGHRDGVYAQLYAANGTVVGSEVQVNTHTTNSQYGSSVTELSGGGYVIAWTSNGGQDGDGNGVYAQRFDASGAKVGAEFAINTTTAGGQYLGSVTALSNGGFVVGWYGSGPDTAAGSYGAYGQRFDASGARVGGEFQINTYTDDDQRTPKLAALNGGDFVATWYSRDQDGSHDGIYAQRFAIQSAPTGTVSLSGTATQGETLTATQTNIADADGIAAGTLNWQWFRDGALVSGAVSNTYLLSEADVGAVIVARYGFTDDLGVDESIASAATVAVTNVNDAPTGSVIASGTAIEGVTLLADVSGVADPDGIDATTVAFQWLRKGVAIEGATGSTYTLTRDDVGAKITVTYTFTDDHGTDESETSAATGTVLSNVVGSKRYYGTEEPDLILANDAANRLYGLGAKDRIYGFAGADLIVGGDGNDRLFGQIGNDSLRGDDGNDKLFGGHGNDGIIGGNGNDKLSGAGGNDTLRGELGDDLLLGGKGNDKLLGRDGKDTLQGGAGDDYMNGGKDADIFVFSSGDGSDRIKGFNFKMDKIKFTADLATEVADVTFNPRGSGVEVIVDDVTIYVYGGRSMDFIVNDSFLFS